MSTLILLMALGHAAPGLTAAPVDPLPHVALADNPDGGQKKKKKKKNGTEGEEE